jgi:plastocyanin
MVEAMGFFPEEITVNTGDAVFFDFGPRFHTATFLSGQERPLLIVPDEAAGTPAAGGDRFIINPAAGFPAGGGTYDGTGYVNSGLPDPSAPPFMLTFTTPGTYDYLCLVHPQMKARVVVQEAGAKPPTDQAAYDRLGDRAGRGAAGGGEGADPAAGLGHPGGWHRRRPPRGRRRRRRRQRRGAPVPASGRGGQGRRHGALDEPVDARAPHRDLPR